MLTGFHKQRVVSLSPISSTPSRHNDKLHAWQRWRRKLDLPSCQPERTARPTCHLAVARRPWRDFLAFVHARAGITLGRVGPAWSG